MSRLKSWSPAKVRLAFLALLLVAAVRLGLSTVPFRVLRRLVHRLSIRGRAKVTPASLTASQIGRGVERVSRYIPGATCLTQALSASILLAWHGYEANVHIGVTRKPAQKLEAHAWVTSEGTVIVGGSDLRRFQPLVILRRNHV